MKFRLFLIFLFLNAMAQAAQHFESTVLATNGYSDYRIYHQPNASWAEKECAEILRSYFKRVTDVDLPVQTELTPEYWSIILKISPSSRKRKSSLNDDFEIRNEARNLIISASTSEGLYNATYQFIESVLGCKKWAPNEEAFCPKNQNLVLDLPFQFKSQRAFVYREVYGLANLDKEYLRWHQLDNLNENWLLWGHSFENLVPSSLFERHPEYFAYFEGKRTPKQLCLTNEAVFELSKEKIRALLKLHPASKYISVSPNDTGEYCQCETCSIVSKKEGGPQGPLIQFVNRIAKRFPEYKIATIAYQQYRNAPLKTRPAKNVVVLVSTIEVNQNQPIEIDPSAENFRKTINDWLNRSPQVWIWDYYAQFTNYLAPFPDYSNLGPNVAYYHAQGVKGVFAQMAEHHYSDLSELKSYLLAKSLSNPLIDIQKLTSEFLNGYYGPNAQIVEQYIVGLLEKVKESEARLDVYGSPVLARKSFLPSPFLESNRKKLENALADTQEDLYRNRMERLLLSTLYAQLQQARQLGYQPYGIYQEEEGKVHISPQIRKDVSRFFQILDKNKITQLAEYGLSASQYKKEWNSLLSLPPQTNKARGIIPKFKTNWIPDYPAVAQWTLTDGMHGFLDFSYNWLLFEQSVEFTMDVAAIKPINSISVRFLEDPNHWIYLPSTIEIWTSQNGIDYKLAAKESHIQGSEKQERQMKSFQFSIGEDFSYIKLKASTADNLSLKKSIVDKKPILALDEIFIQ
ncbi:DUF4838 domain-containing protein [Chryseobacterium sp. A321]